MAVSSTFSRFTVDGPTRLVDWVNVCGPARARQGNANHAVARDNLRELLLSPFLGTCGPHGHNHEAALLVGVLDAYLYLRREDQTEFGEDLTRPAD